MFCLCLCTAHQAYADIAYTNDGKAVGVIVAVVAVAAVASFGTYYAIHHGHNLTGCISGSGSALTLKREGSQDTYVLGGQLEGIQSGDRVHLSGDKVKSASKEKGFQVSKLVMDYGACKSI